MAASSGAAAEVLADDLAAAGVSHVFGIPGEHCLSIVDAVDRHPRLRFVSVRHESAAAFMAEAFGKFTGVPSACLGTASVGAANLVAGVNVAQHDSTPMVVLVGQVETGARGRGAWQELDLVSLFQPLCSYAAEVDAGEQLPGHAARALRSAVSGRGGPVLLSVPVDVQDQAVADRAADPVPLRAGDAGTTRFDSTPPAPAQSDVTRLADLISAAAKPLVIAGGGIRASGGRAELIGVADEVGLPVVTGFRRADAFPNEHPQYVGALSLSTSPEVREAVLAADLIIAVGTRLSEITTMRYAIPHSGQRLAHVDIDRNPDGAGGSAAALRVTADARLTVRELRDECRRRGVRGPSAWWTSHQQARPARLARLTAADPFTRLAAEVAAELDQLLPDDAVITSDAGDFFLACGALIDLRHDRRYLGPTSGSMGYGLPAALAAKLAAPARSVVALCGDGGAMMTIQELETAARCDIPVMLVVFNNRAYGSIVRHQKSGYQGRSAGSELGDLDFSRLAEVFGADGYRAGSGSEFREGLAAALSSGRLSVIEVRL